eukprot:6201423-Pleurochrysis_carterae.AAC.5
MEHGESTVQQPPLRGRTRSEDFDFVSTASMAAAFSLAQPPRERRSERQALVCTIAALCCSRDHLMSMENASGGCDLKPTPRASSSILAFCRLMAVLLIASHFGRSLYSKAQAWIISSLR